MYSFIQSFVNVNLVVLADEMTCPALDCSNTSHIPEISLEPNDDIAGPGVRDSSPTFLLALNVLTCTAQVIIGFVGNAYFALLLLIVYYLVAFDPSQYPFGRRETDTDDEVDHNSDWWRPSPVDTWLLGLIRSNTRRIVKALRLDFFLLHDATKLEPRFVSSVTHMCDLQLLTGIAILVSAYIAVPCTMSAYHWQIVVYLAWFSSITHLSGLIAIRHYLYSRPWERITRIIVAAVFLVMLLVAMVPTAYFDWDVPERQYSTVEMSSTVACLFEPTLGPKLWEQRGMEYCLDRLEMIEERERKEDPELDAYLETAPPLEGEWNSSLSDTSNERFRNPVAYCSVKGVRPVAASISFQSMVFSVFLLTYGFFTRFIRLWEPLARFVSIRIRRPITSLLQRGIKKLEASPPSRKTTALHLIRSGSQSSIGSGKGVWYFLINRPIVAVLVFARLNMDCVASMFGELYWLTSLLLWGTLRLNSTMEHAQGTEALEDEKDWNFGQTLPVLLLVGPMFMVLRTFTTTRVKRLPQEAWEDRRLSVVNDPASMELSVSQPRIKPDSSLDQEQASRSPFLPSRSCSSDLESRMRERNRYTDSPWMGACMISCFMTFTLTTGLTFATLMDVRGGSVQSLSAAWIGEMQLLVYLFLHYPMAMTISILFGVAHDDMCSGHQSSQCKHGKWLSLFIIFVTSAFIGIYFAAMYDVMIFVDIEKWGCTLMGLILAALFCGLYVCLVLFYCRFRRKGN